MEDARNIFSDLGDFEESSTYLTEIDTILENAKKENQYNEACKYMLQGNYPKAYLMFKALGDYEDSASLAGDCMRTWRIHCASVISAGVRSSAGITVDNTVAFSTGDAFLGKKDIQTWDNIMSVSVCGEIVIGLKPDGTVVTAKKKSDERYDSRINTDGWTDIVAVSAGEQYVVGLHSDGTVEAASLLQPDGYGETNVADWENIIAIDTAWQLTVGLDQSGDVHVAGYNAEELQNEIDHSKTDVDVSKRWVDIRPLAKKGIRDKIGNEI